MFQLAKSVLHWYEDIAYQDVGGAKPDPDAAVTLDRLWELCKKYLWGSNKFLSVWTEGNKEPYARHTNNYFFINTSGSSRRDDNSVAGFFAALAIIWLTILITMWIFSGIAFQHVINHAIPAVMRVVNNIFRVIVGTIGAAAGIAISSIMWVFSNHSRSYIDYLKAGANIGFEIGSKAGLLVGFLANIIVFPLTGLAAVILGVAAGLPIGALTVVVAPLQFIKTTYNYVNAKFEAELRNDSTTRNEIPSNEPDEPTADLGNYAIPVLWSSPHTRSRLLPDSNEAEASLPKQHSVAQANKYLNG